MGIMYFLISLLAARISPSLGIFNTVMIGLGFIFVGALSMAVWEQSYGLSVLSFLLPMLITTIGVALILGAGASGALAEFSHIAGTATAVFNRLAISVCWLYCHRHHALFHHYNAAFCFNHARIKRGCHWTF